MAKEVRVTDEMWNDEVWNFTSEAIQTKEKLMAVLKKFHQTGAKGIRNDMTYSDAFYEALDDLLKDFIEEVDRTSLPDPLPEPYSDETRAEAWGYAGLITETGVKLLMELKIMDRPDTCVEDESIGYDTVEEFTLVEIDRALPLTEEEKEAGGRFDIWCWC